MTEPLTDSIGANVIRGRCTMVAKERAEEVAKEGFWLDGAFIPPTAVIRVEIVEEGKPEPYEPGISGRY